MGKTKERRQKVFPPAVRIIAAGCNHTQTPAMLARNTDDGNEKLISLWVKL